jgi:hypothetical protein
MSVKISNVVNRGSVRWIVVAVFLFGTIFGTIFGATGIAAAQLNGTETEYYNETTPITNDTTEIETTINGTDQWQVYANVYRIANDSESTETLVSENVTLSSPSNETANTTYEVQTNNTAAYRVVVHDNNEEISPTASDLGNITVTAFPLDGGGDTLDGGGVGLGGDSGNGTIIGIIAVVALALVIRKA